MSSSATHPRLSEEALRLVAARFKVLGEPHRLLLLQTLQAGEFSVSELVRTTGMSQTNVSRHLQTLADAGMVDRRKVGVSVFYRIADSTIFQLCELMCGSLQRTLDRQEQALGATPRQISPEV